MKDQIDKGQNIRNRSIAAISILCLIVIVIILSTYLLPLFTKQVHSSSSDDSTEESTMSTTSSRGRAFDFSIEFLTDKFIIEPGKEDVVELQLTNNGDADQYSLSIQTPPAGWKVLFTNGKNTYSTSVKSQTYTRILVYIEDTPSSGEILLTVNCKSESNGESKIAEMEIEARYVIQILLMDQKNQQTASAGEKTNFRLEVINHQNVADEVALSIEGKFVLIQNHSDSSEWSAYISNSSFTLASSESKVINVSVFAPVEGTPDDKIVFQVKASIQTMEQNFFSPDLIVVIPKIFNITYELKQKTAGSLILPDSKVNYSLILFNTGNVDTSITLTLQTNPEDWIHWFYDDNDKKFNPNGIIPLDEKDYISLRVELEVPPDAKAGTHTISYFINNKDRSVIYNEFNIHTNVSLKSKLNITVKKEISADLGKTTHVEIELHNQGNGMDKLNISIIELSIPIGWDLYFENIKNTNSETNITKKVDFSAPIKLGFSEPTLYIPTTNDSKLKTLSLILDAGKKAYILLAITTPTTGRPTTETINVYGESVSANIDTVTREISVNLRVSDLSISELLLTPPEPLPGEDVKVQFNVTNKFHLPANNLFVKLYKITDENGKIELNSKQVSNLPAGGSEAVEFSWTEPKDTEEGYILEAEIVGDIIPSNNPITRNKYIIISEIEEEPSDSKEYQNLIMFLSIGIVIMITLFLIIWLVFRSKIQAKERLETEERPKSRGTGTQKRSDDYDPRKQERRRGRSMSRQEKEKIEKSNKNKDRNRKR